MNLCNKEIELEKEIQDTIEILAREVRSQRDNEVSLAEKSYREEHDAHIRKRDQALNRNTRIHELSLEHVDAEFAERVENLILPERVKHTFRRMQEEQPNYEVFEPAKDFPQGIQFGYAGYDITEHTKDELKNTVINKRFGYAVKEANGHKYLVMPYGYSFKDSHFSTLFEFTSASRDQAAETVRNIALNLFMSIPVNKCWCTFIDPVSQGNTFAVFSPMGEKDEKGNGDERVIDIRIWSDDNQIEERLKLIVDHTADIIQHCLQGRYDNILDYNMDAGINAEPLRFLVIMDFPKHFTERAISYLESIIDNGPKTGVYTIIVADKIDIENQGEESPAHRIWNRIRNKVVVEDDILYIQESTRDGKMRYFPFSSPTNEQYIDIISEIRKHLGEEVVITYPMVSSNLPETPDYWFHRSAIDGISVPIGMEGAGKIINLEFGRKYHSFAAMIGGTTGAGKSSLMHTIIQSVIFNYSPEEVQMFLLDFKQGVEFKCYADLKLPNFRVISVETEPEFGLAVLNELHEEMVRRSSKFRSVGVGTIESYWRYRGERGESHADMPRLLIIFDEIQMLLFEAENEVSQKCVARIKELVTQGVRAFGIHLMGDIFDVPNSTVPPEEWIKRSAIVELESLGKNPANYMTLLIATLIRETLKVEDYNKKALGGKPRHVMFLEEAHNLIGPVAQPTAGEEGDAKTAATAYIVKMLAEVRALGEGIVIADQLPTAMAPEIIKNTSLKIGLRITAQDDRELLGSTMSANPDQLEKMAVFTPGQALCSYEPLLKPFEIQIPYFEAKEGNLDDAVVMQILGSHKGYQKDLLASIEISSRGWQNKWDHIEMRKELFFEALKEYTNLEERKERYEPASASKRQFSSELKKIRKDLGRKYASIIHEAQNLNIAVYAYYSPFAVVFETPDAFGNKEEDRLFRNHFRSKVVNEVIKYKRRLKKLESDAALYGYTVKESTQERLKECRLILSKCSDTEKKHWKEVAGTYFVIFNVNSPIFEGKTVDQAIAMRKAFAILIDRPRIVEYLDHTGLKVATSFIPAGMADGNGGIFKGNSDSYTFPVEDQEGYYPEEVSEGAIDEAIALLEYAGYKFDDSGMLSESTPINITYLTNDGTGHIGIAKIIQQDLAEIGVNMKIDTREWNLFLDETKQGNFDFARGGWLADFNDPINMLEMWTADSGNNDCQFGR